MARYVVSTAVLCTGIIGLQNDNSWHNFAILLPILRLPLSKIFRTDCYGQGWILYLYTGARRHHATSHLLVLCMK